MSFLSPLRRLFYKNATEEAQIDHLYEVTNSDLFNKTAFGRNVPETENGDMILCLGKGGGGHPSFMIATRENGKRPDRIITTNYKADGTPESFGLKHLGWA